LKRNISTQKSDTSLEPKKNSILKRRVGYGDSNEINEEEEVRREKRNKMDIDASAMTSILS
jgi:hypothetical protein